MKIIVCLLSSGIDSCVASTIKAKEPNTEVYLLSIFYGQGAEQAEKRQATKVADKLMEMFPNVVEHFILQIDGKSRKHKYKNKEEANKNVKGFVGWRTPQGGWDKAGYPSTRDEVFALMAGAGVEARLRENRNSTEGEVVLSTNGEDLENFEDIEKETYEIHLNEVLKRKIMPRRGKQIRISLPLINMKKSDVIRKGLELGAPLELTWSCYFGKPGKPCNNCDQCRWRANAFREVGIKDPFIVG